MPALAKVLLVAVVIKVIGKVLVEVSVIVAPGLLVRVTGVTPLPASVTRPEPLIFSAPKLSQLLSVSVAVPVTFVVAVAPVVSSPDPVTTPPLQLNVLFSVRSLVPVSVPADNVNAFAKLNGAAVPKFAVPALICVTPVPAML